MEFPVIQDIQELEHQVIQAIQEKTEVLPLAEVRDIQAILELMEF